MFLLKPGTGQFSVTRRYRPEVSLKLNYIKAIDEAPALLCPLPLPKYVPGEDEVPKERRNKLMITRDS